MNCEFYKDNNFIDNCNQTNIPRVNDSIILNDVGYTILTVTWNYDTRDIRIDLKGAD